MDTLRPNARLLILATACLATACATVPSQEMSDARQSLEAARDAGAALYAPQELKKAETLLDSAAEKLAHHAYRRAGRDAAAAQSTAIRARNIAVAIGTARIMAREAANLGVLTPTVNDLLAKAELAATAGDERTAVLYANSASEHLRRAIRAMRPAEPGAGDQ